MMVQDLHTEFTTYKHTLRQMVDYKDNSIKTKTLVDKPTGAMKLLAFDDGTRLKEHTAPHDVHLLILEGEAFELHAGEIITLPVTRPHAVNALTRFKMLLTMFRNER